MSSPACQNASLICVVDDDNDVRKAFGFLLRTHGFEVEEFDSPSALLASPAIHRSACFVLDMHMPSLSGLEILGMLRKRQINAPAILVTGGDSPQLRSQAAESGVAAFLAKPVDGTLLVSTIQAATAA